jgi:epoxyqueuosine reductase
MPVSGEGAALARERTEAIRARAKELGFDGVGFARAEPADPDRRLRAWLARGFDAGMSYMAEDAAGREDPRKVVPGARSVIALSISYYSEAGVPDPNVKVSRYAMIDDYHGMLQRRVRKLRRRILQLDPSARVHPSVDTSAVMERAWAERSGIAWVGKSTMAIAQDLGTYTFLATLITTMELEYGEPHPDRCGSCTRCLDACPTDAFAGPYELDARKCISYWTIEHRGDFDATTPDLHGWIGGCDVCQEVCPWNKFAKPTAERRWAPRAELLHPNLEDEASVERAIRGTPLVRPGVEGVERNLRRR